MRNETGTRTYTVGQLARLSGVSVRTLHHYDEIGLLKPASVGENAYRLYGREELLRLQQVLFHRELGMSLADIAAALDAPEFDQLSALRRHREQVRVQVRRHRRLLITIDRTIGELEGTMTMADTDLYKGFTPERQTAYEAELLERFGECARPAIEHGRRRRASATPQEIEAEMAKLAVIEGELTQAMAEGVSCDDPALNPVLARHHAWVAAAWGRSPSAEAYAGLGELYESHPDFIARFEALRPDLAPWLAAAMRAFARTL